MSFLKENIVLLLATTIFLLSVGFGMREILFHQILPMFPEFSTYIDAHDHTGEIEKKINTMMFHQKIILLDMVFMSVSGTVIFFILCLKMVNLYKVNEQKKRLIEETFEHMAAIELCNEGIGIFDPNFGFVYCNKSFYAMFGFHEQKNILGNHWDFLFDNQSNDYFNLSVLPSLSKTFFWRGEINGKKKDGHVFPIEIHINLLPAGRIICVTHDISERVKKDRILNMISIAVEAAEDGIAITDQDHKLLFMNRSFLKLHGYDVHDPTRYVGMDWRDIYNQKGKDQINKISFPALQIKGHWMGDIKVTRKDGQLFDAEAALTRLPDGKILGVVRDISERKAVERGRETLKDQIFQTKKAEAMNRLARTVATNFDTLITSMRQDLTTLQSACRCNAAANVAIQALMNSCDKGKALVEELGTHKNYQDRLEQSADLRTLIEGVLSAMQKDHENTIEKTYNYHLEETRICARSTEVQRILFNILKNSEEALLNLSHKSPRIDINVKHAHEAQAILLDMLLSVYIDGQDQVYTPKIFDISGGKRSYIGYLDPKRSYIWVHIQDNGRGIDSDIFSKIFEPYFTTRQNGHSLGLGLPAVINGLQSSQGAMILETWQGVGTHVHLFFPSDRRA